MDEIAAVVKGGTTRIQTLLSRRNRRHGEPSEWKGGIIVEVHAQPEIEEFIRSLGAGHTADASTIGRHWQQLGREPLEVYVTQPIPTMQSDDGSLITLDLPGQPLYSRDTDGPIQRSQPIVNLSFLKLKGISEGAGVTFGIRGSVLSLSELRVIRDRIQAAQRRFYIEYMRPVDLLVTVSTQELQL